MKLSIKKYFFVIFLLICCNYLIAQTLKVYFIDVGQGDATFIVTPKETTILIDGGDRDDYQDYGERVVKLIKKLGYNSIDNIFLTHAHRDHVAGLKYVIENLKVKNFYDTGFVYPTVYYMEILELVKEKKIKYILGRKKENVIIEPNFEVSILYPPTNFIFDNPNDNSMVIRIRYKDISVLVTGDIERAAEEEIVKTYGNKMPEKIESNILKVPHHGSGTSSTLSFLALVKPEVGIIMCGKNNRFGHPRQSTLTRYKRLGIEIFRTDLDGTIEFIIDGKDYKIKTYKTN